LKIIGVIDLLGGVAVHAQGGCRQGYRPVGMAGGTPIQGDLAALTRLYTERLGIDEVYIADLDAIAGGAEQDAAVRTIARTGVSLWLDAGVSTIAQARRAIDRGALRVVVGLETLTSFEALREISEVITSDRVAFSLDLRDGRPVARDEQLRDRPIDDLAAQAVNAGARSVIVLDVARVGSGRGIDLSALAMVKRAIPDVTLLAGGGVRGVEDLRDLVTIGCDGVLVATALYGSGGADLVRFAAGNGPPEDSHHEMKPASRRPPRHS
jgi:phosphoribosylformimino-5-aminoimidazole carboxamide ribotide isomerase